MGYKLAEFFKGGFGQMPSCIFDGGHYADMSPSTAKLLAFLFHLLNRKSSPSFKVSLSVLKSELGMDEKTIRKARVEAQELRFLQWEYDDSPGKPIIFHILSQNGEKMPMRTEYVPTYLGKGQTRTEATPVRKTNCLRPAASDNQRLTVKPEQPIRTTDAETMDSTRTMVCTLHPNEGSYQHPDGSTRCLVCDRKTGTSGEFRKTPERSAAPIAWDDIGKYSHP